MSQFPGIKPAPMPCILCGPGLPPEITGLSAGSTAIIFTLSLTVLRNCGNSSKYDDLVSNYLMSKSVVWENINIVYRL